MFQVSLLTIALAGKRMPSQGRLLVLPGRLLSALINQFPSLLDYMPGSVANGVTRRMIDVCTGRAILFLPRFPARFS